MSKWEVKQLTERQFNIIVSSAYPVTTLEHVTLATNKRKYHNFLQQPSRIGTRIIVADTKHFQLKKKVKNQKRERYGVSLFLVLDESFRQFCETFSGHTVQLEMSNIRKLHNIHTGQRRQFIALGTRGFLSSATRSFRHVFGQAEDVSETAHEKPLAPRVAFHTSFLVFPLNCKGRKSKQTTTTTKQ